MAELHEALKSLCPVIWEDVPQDDLPNYLRNCFNAGELICNSVPPPPNGVTFESSQLHFQKSNVAQTAKEIHPSTARAQPPHEEHVGLQTNWGKPLKVSKNSNPFNTAIYKMAGHDRHGAWFARHTVVEGISFTSFKDAMQREFAESMLETGEPGAGAKRGLGADRLLADIDVPGVGKLEVYQLSAKMPPPVTPRDFLTLLMTTDKALGEKSANTVQDAGPYVPRHWMVLSKPLQHADAPAQPSYVRGKYESVELIREIPLHTSKTNDKSDDPELNPIEWIMITRSDPGGGIPRFLVDRGTPDAMLADLTKFFNFACAPKAVDNAVVEEKDQQSVSEQVPILESRVNELAAGQQKAEIPVVDKEQVTAIENRQNGVGSSIASTLEAYAPTSVSNFVNSRLHPEQSHSEEQQHSPISDDTSSDAESVASFMSVEEYRRLSTVLEQNARPSPAEVLSIGSRDSSELSKPERKRLNQHEKEMLKLMQQREKLDEKLAKKREAEENRLKQSQEKEQSEQDKAKERLEREMKKSEEKHRKEIIKLEARREKEARKAEERQRKKDEQNRLSIVARERDEHRSTSTYLKKENALLLQQVEELQRENTMLTNALGKAAGADAVKIVHDEMESSRKRSSTLKSADSRISGDSSRSGEKKSASREVVNSL